MAPLIKIFSAALLLAGLARPAFADPSKEYQVKAVFLFHFAQFVEWPAEAFSGPDSPLVIGVVGNDPFGAYLDEVVRGEKIKGRPIAIKRYGGIEEMSGCHILFMETSQVPRIGALKRRPILTVGEAEAFSDSGGMIRFATQNTKLRLKINLKAIQAADLSVSSKLLRLADIVSPGKG